MERGEMHTTGLLRVRLNEFRLQVGLNILDYSANAGRESATVSIRFRERYTGI